MKIKTQILCLLSLTVLFSNCKNDIPKKNSFLFEKLDVEQSNITFKNLLTEDEDHSIINYIYYYNGAGVASGDINNDGLPDLFFVSNLGDNELYINKGNLKFELSEQASQTIKGKASWQTGVTMLDINNDGFLDIYVCAVSGLLDFTGSNELYINNGDGTFTEKAKEYGLDLKSYATQSYFFDYDKDGDLDVYIVNHAIHTTLSHGSADARNERKPLVGDVLLMNDNGKFKDVSEEANIFGGVNSYGLSASIADFNNDGWDDIYVCNDFHEDDYYYINNQDGTFSEELSESFPTISRFSMGSDAGDINGDGYQDLITLDMLPMDEKTIKETEGDDAMFNMQERLRNLGYRDQYSRNMLQVNNSGETFYEIANYNNLADTDWSWAPLIADFDSDGNNDIFISNGILRRPNSLDFKKYVSNAFKGRSQSGGIKWLYNSIGEMPGGAVANQIYKGDGDLGFDKMTGNWITDEPSLSNGAIYSDLDRDGDLDLVVNNINHYSSIYKNTTSKNNYITVELKYEKQNIEAIGSKVWLFSNNNSQMQQVFKSRGFLSSIESKITFGLGQSKSIDSIKIEWPNNTFQVIKQPKTNSQLEIVYDSTKVKSKEKANENQKSNFFEKINTINYLHKEDSYNDFYNNRLSPYKVSTLGPASAIGDIDNNGYDDIYIGGASGQPGEIYFNDGNRFYNKKGIFQDDNEIFEDNAAEFIDIDGDNDLDLYIGSGVSLNQARTVISDRLYINDNGTFKRIKNDKIPENLLVTSTVEKYDYDQDGDNDLFIGNISRIENLGPNVESYILINNGDGTMSKDKNFKISSKVSSATWKDLDNDGIKDLFVACHWSQPKIFLNKSGQLKPITLNENLKGLWEAIDMYDVDNDGDQDIVLGNWGLNTRFNKYQEGPLRLYYNDFDNNGRAETVVAYKIKDNYYPVNSKEELAAEMPLINKKFLLHRDFALKNMNEIFSTKKISESVIFEANTLESGYLENVNGTFDKFIPFKTQLQLGPINSFDHLNYKDNDNLIVTGNSLKVNSYHGGFKSLQGYIINTDSEVQSLKEYGIQPITEQVKAVKILEGKSKNFLIILKNNAKSEVYEFEKESQPHL